MARPRKQEVDYFPHYCDHGKVLFILENHFKNDGYAVFYKIEEVLSKTEGHCYDCSRLENWEYLLSKMLPWARRRVLLLGNHERFPEDFVKQFPQFSELLDFKFINGIQDHSIEIIDIKLMKKPISEIFIIS